jgi:hypothetical protein
MDAVRADVGAEVGVQLGIDLKSVAASEVKPENLEELFIAEAVQPIVMVTLDQWLPRLVDSLDRNVVLLTRAGTALLLANQEIAERILAAAPDLRNRITDILSIRRGIQRRTGMSFEDDLSRFAREREAKTEGALAQMLLEAPGLLSRPASGSWPDEAHG